jgi:hypothetical protein
VVSKVRKILAVSKPAAQKFVGERFTLRNLNELGVRRQYQIEISKMLAALEKLSDKESLTPNKIYSKFVKVYGDSSPSFSTIKKWAA